MWQTALVGCQQSECGAGTEAKVDAAMVERVLRTFKWLLWMALVAVILYPATAQWLPAIDCLGGMVWAG